MKLLTCDKCGYHYPPEKMARERRTNAASGKSHTRVYCLDRVRCTLHINQREADKEALR